jgi:hypothetical protein
MTVYVSPLPPEHQTFFGKPNGYWLYADSNAEAVKFAKLLGIQSREAWRPTGDRARLDRFPLSLDQAKEATESGAVFETWGQYRNRVEERIELLRENAEQR